MENFYQWLQEGDPALWAVFVNMGYHQDERFLAREHSRLDVRMFFGLRGFDCERVGAAWKRYVREMRESEEAA